MMKSLLIVAATTTVASANTIDLFATSAFDSSSYLIGSSGLPYDGQFIQALSSMDAVVDPNTGNSVWWQTMNGYAYDAAGQEWLESDYEASFGDYSTDGLFGDGAAHKFYSPPWANAGSGAAILLDIAKLNDGDVLDWSIDMYAPSGDGLFSAKDSHRAYVALGIQYADGSWAEIQALNSFDWQTEGIQQLVGTYTITGEETRIEFKYGIHNDGEDGDWGSVVMDNRGLTLTLVPAPGALGLLGLAAAGRRRRK